MYTTGPVLPSHFPDSKMLHKPVDSPWGEAHRTIQHDTLAQGLHLAMWLLRRLVVLWRYLASCFGTQLSSHLALGSILFG